MYNKKLIEIRETDKEMRNFRYGEINIVQSIKFVENKI